MVADVASGEASALEDAAAAAMVWTSRVGRSLKISRSPDLLSLQNHIRANTSSMCEGILLWFAACKHVEPLTLIACTKKSGITSSFICKDWVGRSCHSDSRKSFLRRSTLIQAQVHPSHCLILTQKSGNAICYSVDHCVLR